MPGVSLPPNLQDVVATTFTFRCNTCGTTVHVVDTEQQPHRCRVEIPERVAR